MVFFLIQGGWKQISEISASPVEQDFSALTMLLTWHFPEATAPPLYL